MLSQTESENLADMHTSLYWLEGENVSATGELGVASLPV